MKKWIILFGLLLFATSVNAGDVNFPDLVGLRVATANGNIQETTTYGDPVVFQVKAWTDFNPAPTTTLTCPGICRLVVQDCNGTLAGCNQLGGGDGDWNGINTILTFEGDMTCRVNCRRNTPIEDTEATMEITLYPTGSRWFRACWFPNINNPPTVCSKPIRIHLYKNTPAIPGQDKGSCIPQNNGDLIIYNQTCEYRKPSSSVPQVPTVVFVDRAIKIGPNGILDLNGAHIEFNSLVPTQQHDINLYGYNAKIRFGFDQVSKLDKNGNTDYGQNKIEFFGYSTD